MKIRSIILTYDNPLYNYFDTIKTRYYDSIGHDYILVYNSNSEFYYNEDKKIVNYNHGDWSYNSSGIPIMLDKFIDIIDRQFTNNYDFIIRENSSTFTNIPIIKQLLTQHRNNHYAGFFDPTWNFVSGACTIFSQPALQCLYQNRNHLVRNIEDDVAIGSLLTGCGIQKTFIDRYSIHERHDIPEENEIHTALTFPQIRIRNDHDRTNIDIGIWNKISNLLKLD